MMSTPSACLDTKDPQPGQQKLSAHHTASHLGKGKHLCPPLQHLSLLRQFAVSVHTGPVAAQTCTQQVFSTGLSLARASRFLASWIRSHGPGSISSKSWEKWPMKKDTHPRTKIKPAEAPSPTGNEHSTASSMTTGATEKPKSPRREQMAANAKVCPRSWDTWHQQRVKKNGTRIAVSHATSPMSS